MKTTEIKDLSWLRTESMVHNSQAAVKALRRRLIILKTMLGILMISFVCVCMQII